MLDRTQDAGADFREASPARAWGTMALLAALYIISYVDRGVLALLVQPLKADFHLSDLEVSLLYGTAFAVFYSLLGLPISRIADRANRYWLIIAGVLLWGASTIASGFAESYAMLMILRVGLALGEAALTPSAFSMMADMFSPRTRPFAASVYKAVGNIGVGGGMVVVGLLIAFFTSGVASGEIRLGLRAWQLVLVSVGVPAILLALVFALLCREPARRPQRVAEGSSNRELLAFFGQNKRLFVGLFVGAGFMQVIAGVFPAWGPEFMRRTYHWDVKQVATTMGTLISVTSIISILSGPVITRFLERRGRPDAVFLVALYSCVIGTVLSVLAYLQRDAALFIPLYIASAFCISGGSGNVLFLVPNLVPSRMVGTFVCVLISIFNLFALGFGPPIAALISDGLSVTGDRLNYAIAMQCAICGVLAIALLAWGRGAYAVRRASEPALA